RLGQTFHYARRDRERQQEVKDRRGNVQGDSLLRQTAGGGYGRGNGQHRPQDNVLEHGHAQHQPGKARVQDFEVEKDPRNHWNGSHGNSDAHHQDERNAAGFRAHEPRERKSGGAQDHRQERQPSAQGREPGNLFAFVSLEQGFDLRAGEKHEQQQAQPGKQIQRG